MNEHDDPDSEADKEMFRSTPEELAQLSEACAEKKIRRRNLNPNAGTKATL